MNPLNIHIANISPPPRRRWSGIAAHLGIGVALGWALALTALYFIVGRG